MLQLSELTEACQSMAWALREEPPTGVDSLAGALNILREARRALGDAERDIEAHLAEAMGDEKVMVIAGIGSLERKASPVKPSWDHEGLRKLIAAASRDERVLNESTGEIEGEAEAALRVLLDCAAVTYYRMGKLKDRGIDGKRFREQESWRTTVRIIPETP